MSQKGIQTAYNKSNKKSYKYLNSQEKRLLKINEELEGVSKFLNHLWSIAPRKENGGVDWRKFEKVNKRDYEFLLNYLKIEEKTLKSKNRLIERYNLNEDKILSLFNETQFRLSQSY